MPRPVCAVAAGGLIPPVAADHVLLCDDTPIPASATVHRLNEVAPTLLNQIHECRAADLADRVLIALRALHEEFRFGVIHFPRLGGTAFRCIQAKRCGLVFDDTELIVHADQTSRQEREKRNRWPAGPDDLIVDYMEQYSSSATPAVPAAASSPLVTIGIAFYNLGEFLPVALESLTRQTYTNTEIIIIDDGSTDLDSVAAFDQLQQRYPAMRFLRQANAGIGATRNRLLTEARGEFFIPMDADNVARPEMVATFVRAMQRNPHLSAMTCYFEAFSDDADIAAGRLQYAVRPTGGPHILSCIRNVYGDANGIFRTADFRAVGGYETDRGTSCEDWEAYVKLVHAGKRIDVIPATLFYYRHRGDGFSRATNWFANHQRVLRQFTNVSSLSAEDAASLWTALLGFHQENERLKAQQQRPRYRAADAMHNTLARPYRWLRRRLTPRL
jgi:glycosyltransferase involved in cell wall biosynthesis